MLIRYVILFFLFFLFICYLLGWDCLYFHTHTFFIVITIWKNFWLPQWKRGMKSKTQQLAQVSSSIPRKLADYKKTPFFQSFRPSPPYTKRFHIFTYKIRAPTNTTFSNLLFFPTFYTSFFVFTYFKQQTSSIS